MVQMASINTKYQALVVGVSNSAKGKPKSKNSKLPDKKKSEKPKSSEGATNPPKEKEKKGKEKAKCYYFQKGWHRESSCMKKTIDTITRLLEKNNIPVPDNARKKDGNSSSSQRKEKCHALVAGISNSSSFIIDLGASRHMVSRREFFSSMISNASPAVRMGDEL